MTPQLIIFISFFQMAVVDRELEALGEEREEKSRRLNLKRMQHISTLQQLSNFFLYSSHRQENRRLVGHFYDMKNRFWAVGCGLGCGIKGLGRL